MNEYEYLSKLQRNACNEMGIPYNLFLEVEGKSGKIETFAKELIKRLGKGYESLSFIQVGFLPLDDFNAGISPETGNKPIIVIYWALPLVLTNLNASIHSMVRKQSMLDFISMAVTCACSIKFGYSKVQWPKISLEFLESNKKTIHEMVDAQISFVLLHEFSHHLLNHLNPERISKCLLTDTSDEYVNFYTLNQREELEADCKAAELFGKIFGNKKDNYYSSIYLLTELWMLYETMFPRIRPSPSHPSASDRWREISKTLACNDETQLKTVEWTKKCLMD